MSFSDILKDVVSGTEGAVGAVIIGLDGIPVQEYTLDGVDVQSLAVEYSLFLREIEKGSQAAELGLTREVSVLSDKAMVVLRRLNDEYYLALIIKPEGNFGKGRYLLRMSASRLLPEF